MRYRVWCLSWDDTEDDGRDVVGYDPIATDMASLLETRDIMVPFYNLGSASEAAERYAYWCHSHRDAYECSWPLTFRVLSENGTEKDFDVEREMRPTFKAREAKSP